MSRENDQQQTRRTGPDSGPSAPDRMAEGEGIAGYSIQSLAGVGGMGVVYRAFDPALGRTVALKLIISERADDEGQRALFVRESLVAASIEHPNIVPIYAAGEDSGRLFIAMRFIEGASLGQVIRAAGRITPARVVSIASQVAAALDAAHARGLVHRDVKPANILLATPGPHEHVYLTDFGLSVPVAGLAGRAESQGGWAGTLDYVSPEQIRGGRIDLRTDVYALGCVIHHALAGAPPFSSANDEDTLIAHLSEPPPPPSASVPGLPAAVDEVVRRALQKRPQDRFASAGELAEALRRARHGAILIHAPADVAAAGSIAQSLTDEGLAPHVVSGAPGDEEQVRIADGCALLVGSGGIAALPSAALDAAAEMAASDRAFSVVLVHLPSSTADADQYPDGLALSARIELSADLEDPIALERLAAALRDRRLSRLALAREEGESPYLGLMSFREEDRALFFGREAEARQLLERLGSERFIAVLGNSGAGKSSLVHAGVLPVLREAGARIASLSPGSHPLEALAAALERATGAPGPAGGSDARLDASAVRGPSPGSYEGVLARLETDDKRLNARSAALRTHLADVLQTQASGLVIVIDQFEEMFTLVGDPRERELVFDLLSDAIAVPSGATVLLTMRADFYHRLSDHLALSQLVSAHQVFLGPLRASNLRRAIEEPARLTSLDLEPGLVARILREVADQPGSLALVEHLLLELWRRREGRHLTLEAYEASGGVDGALARRANKTYASLSPAGQRAARRILLRLVVPGEGDAVTRRRARRQELIRGSADESETESVLTTLAGSRLIAIGSDERTGEAVIDLAHEALIRGWPELRAWIDEDRERLRAERRLSEAAEEWEASGRDEDLLYADRRLADWDGQSAEHLSGLERRFLNESRTRRRRERKRRRTRLRGTIAGLIGALVIVGGLATYALLQSREAERRRDEAVSRQLASSANQQLTSNPELGLLLAREAVSVSQTREATESLRSAVRRSRLRKVLRPDPGSIAIGAGYLAGGRTIATATRRGGLRIWDPETQAVRLVTTGQKTLTAFEISPDGRTIATGAINGSLRLWTADGSPMRSLESDSKEIDGLAFTSDGKRLLSTGKDGAVRVFDVASGERDVFKSLGRTWLFDVAVSPDDQFFATGDVLGTSVLISDLQTGHLKRAIFFYNQVQVTALAYSPSGRFLAVGASDYSLRIWDLRRRGSEPRYSDPLDEGTLIQSLSWSRDGNRIIGSTTEGTIRIWSSRAKSLAVLRGSGDPFQMAKFGPGGRMVVSAADDGSVGLWDWSASRPIAEAPSPDGTLPFSGDMLFSSDSASLIEVTERGTLARWDLRSPSPTVSRPAFAGSSTAVTDIAASGDHYARLRTRGSLVVESTQGSDPPGRLLPGSERGITFWIAIDGHGERLASVGDDGAMRIWDVAGGTSFTLDDQPGDYSGVDLTPDGSRAVVATRNGARLSVWDLHARKDVASTRHGKGIVSQIHISPDGTKVLAGNFNGSATLWNLETDRSITLGGHTGATYADFSPDGSRVVSSSSSSVQVWDARTGENLLRLPIASGGAFKAVLSPDLAHLVVQNRVGAVRLYSCDTCGSLAKVKQLAAERTTRSLTAEERRTFGVPG